MSVNINQLPSSLIVKKHGAEIATLTELLKEMEKTETYRVSSLSIRVASFNEALRGHASRKEITVHTEKGDVIDLRDFLVTWDERGNVLHFHYIPGYYAQPGVMGTVFDLLEGVLFRTLFTSITIGRFFNKKAALAHLQSNDEADLLTAIGSIERRCRDLAWAEIQIGRCLSHSNENVRFAAISTLGHLYQRGSSMSPENRRALEVIRESQADSLVKRIAAQVLEGTYPVEAAE